MSSAAFDGKCVGIWVRESPEGVSLVGYGLCWHTCYGPVHLLVASALKMGVAWDSAEEGRLRPSLLPLGILAGSLQHYRAAILDAWRHRASSQLCARVSFQCGPLPDILGTVLLSSILCGRVWN